ncbi:hypothetical protein LEMLEM_LOCUS1626, partial [Lemmus lemmus]
MRKSTSTAGRIISWAGLPDSVKKKKVSTAQTFITLCFLFVDCLRKVCKVVAHAINPSARGDRGRWIFVTSRPNYSIKRVPRQ